MTELVAALRDVRVAIRNRVLLEVPDLEIRQGQVLTIMGPNGAGKSTLLRVIAMLQRPAAGNVYHDGNRVVSGRDALRWRRRLALVMQQPLFRNMSTWDNVATGLRFRHVSRKEMRHRVDMWLERLGIAHLAKQNALSLSGGEAQRASLARGMVLEPDLLLLDEPFGALDPQTRVSLLNDLLEILSDVKTTTVFVTHDRSEALALGDTLAVMIDGRIRQIGPAEEVFAMPVSEEVAAVVGVENVLRGHVTNLESGLAIVAVGGQEVTIVGEWRKGDELVLGIRPEVITLEPGRDRAGSTSARNRLAGRIIRITPVEAQARVVVDCGSPLVSLVTRQSVADLGLVPGIMVTATFKASAVHVIRNARAA